MYLNENHMADAGLFSDHIGYIKDSFLIICSLCMSPVKKCHLSN